MTGLTAIMPGIFSSGGGGGGGGGTLDNELVTVEDYILGVDIFFRGFSRGLMGGIADGAFAPKAGAVINGIYMDMNHGIMTFILNGSHTNNGWSSMKIGSLTLNRAAASFTAASYSSRWSWSGVSDPFSSSPIYAEFS